jgi:NADP-dependent aldehyde dehydrogenase
MNLEGTSILGFSRARSDEESFHAVRAATGEALEPPYWSVTYSEIDQAVRLAASAFPAYRAIPRRSRAEFLRQIAGNLEHLGEPLVERVVEETGLLPGRVRAERDRTCFQLRFFAGIVEEGSWVDARIDTGDPGRKPAPKPDIRSMLRPLGPVAIFCASNFPLAFSVAGGDTSSALAAGNPVVVNAHFSHPAVRN